MTRKEFAATGLGPRVLNSVAMIVLQRQVDCVQLHSAKRHTASGEIFEIRLSVDLPDGDDGSMLVKRLNRLVDVVKVVRFDPAASHRQRAILVQVEADERQRGSVVELAGVYGAKVLELTRGTVTLQYCAAPERVTELMDLLAPFGVVRLADAGTLTLPRALRSSGQKDREEDTWRLPDRHLVSISISGR